MAFEYGANSTVVPHVRTSPGGSLGRMSEITIIRYKISVFHNANEKHAGTVEVSETIHSLRPDNSDYRWTWHGGPFGPLEGYFEWWNIRVPPNMDQWLFDNPSMHLVPLAAKTTMHLTNYRWTKGGWPHPHPWFKRTDRVISHDPNFPHAWRCRFSAAG